MALPSQGIVCFWHGALFLKVYSISLFWISYCIFVTQIPFMTNTSKCALTSARFNTKPVMFKNSLSKNKLLICLLIYFTEPCTQILDLGFVKWDSCLQHLSSLICGWVNIKMLWAAHISVLTMNIREKVNKFGRLLFCFVF